MLVVERTMHALLSLFIVFVLERNIHVFLFLQFLYSNQLTGWIEIWKSWRWAGCCQIDCRVARQTYAHYFEGTGYLDGNAVSGKLYLAHDLATLVFI